MIQYIYSEVFPYIYTTTENRGVNFKIEFQLKLKGWNSKKTNKKLCCWKRFNCLQKKNLDQRN